MLKNKKPDFLIKEAKSCFDRVLQEGKKESNVDIQLMLETSQRCLVLVQQLCSLEESSEHMAVLNCLRENVESHVDILTAKIDQLNRQADQQVPTTDQKDDHEMQSQPSEKGDKKSSTKGDHQLREDSRADNQQPQRRAAIEETIVRKGGITFHDIAGLNEAKEALTEAIVMPLQFPHLFTGCIKPWKRILLYGPPGTGKSRLAEAISGEINFTFYCVSSSDLVSSWVGESEKLIKELFQHATCHTGGRSVIFIDEIDSICRQRSSREEEHTRRMKTELLKQMEGADNSSTNDKIFLLCATNCPWELDTAFLRRFQKRIYIPLPDREARISLIKIHTKENKLELSDDEWLYLADKTDGYSGSDIANMTLGALFGPIRDLRNAQFWCQTKDGMYTPCDEDAPRCIKSRMTTLPPDKIQPREVQLGDFIKSLQTHRQTVTEADLKKFSDFTSHFRENG
ncbi:vacuolar protein sorting-associated protein 4-like [Mya arenaria]|uniref:vacuolar protein sorting-associated protein 4-like n=1 Tax=Mya arenaria TaxID=6604 RepID=UPI0022E0C837|nr:vacuolar protein sorting-associated protein 4-like [Mya arenaria]